MQAFIAKLQKSDAYEQLDDKLTYCNANKDTKPLDELLKECWLESSKNDYALEQMRLQVTKLRKQLNECNLSCQKQIFEIKMSKREAGRGHIIEFYEPLQYLDEGTREIVLSIVTDKMHDLEHGVATASLLNSMKVKSESAHVATEKLSQRNRRATTELYDVRLDETFCATRKASVRRSSVSKFATEGADAPETAECAVTQADGAMTATESFLPTECGSAAPQEKINMPLGSENHAIRMERLPSEATANAEHRLPYRRATLQAYSSQDSPLSDRGDARGSHAGLVAACDASSVTSIAATVQNRDDQTASQSARTMLASETITDSDGFSDDEELSTADEKKKNNSQRQKCTGDLAPLSARSSNDGTDRGSSLDSPAEMQSREEEIQLAVPAGLKQPLEQASQCTQTDAFSQAQASQCTQTESCQPEQTSQGAQTDSSLQAHTLKGIQTELCLMEVSLGEGKDSQLKINFDELTAKFGQVLDSCAERNVKDVVNELMENVGDVFERLYQDAKHRAHRIIQRQQQGQDEATVPKGLDYGDILQAMRNTCAEMECPSPRSQDMHPPSPSQGDHHPRQPHYRRKFHVRDLRKFASTDNCGSDSGTIDQVLIGVGSNFAEVANTVKAGVCIGPPRVRRGLEPDSLSDLVAESRTITSDSCSMVPEPPLASAAAYAFESLSSTKRARPAASLRMPASVLRCEIPGGECDSPRTLKAKAVESFRRRRCTAPDGADSPHGSANEHVDPSSPPLPSVQPTYPGSPRSLVHEGFPLAVRGAASGWK